jgi:hypothetical protein
MNIITAIILKILSNPYFSYNKWWVDVEYDSYGAKGNTKLIFNSKDEANSLEVGQEIDI